MTTLSEAPEKVEEKTELQQHQQVIDLLKGRCLEMSFTVHGLPKSRRIKGKNAQTAAHALKGRTRGIRSSWSMFTSEHPAVRQLNQAVRDLEHLRDTWTIVRSPEVQNGEGKITIEGGVRLIWDADVPEFYKLFCTKAAEIDLAAELVQKHMDAPMTVVDPNDESNQKVYPSIKKMDEDNAGDAWDESVYPKDVRLVAGAAKERLPDGMPALDENGNPKYIIRFDEYHVSEKLPEMLRERAMERLDAKMSDTVETAFGYAIAELNEDLTTFMAELVNRVRIYPKSHPFADYCEVEPAEVIKAIDHDKDSSVPEGQVKLLLAYKEIPPGGDKSKPVTVRKWMEPISLQEYQTKVRPQSTGEKKKLYPAVIEGIIAKMQSFRDKKAKMLGAYGTQALADFDDLFKELTKFKQFHTSNAEAAQKLTAKLKTNNSAKEEIAQVIADTVASLEDRVESVKQVVRRRKISAKLIGKV